MNTTFNRVLKIKNPRKVFKKLQEMGFLYAYDVFSKGRGMRLIKLNNKVNSHFCLLEDHPFWEEDKIWNQKPIGDFELIHDNEIGFSKQLCLVDFYHNNVTDHPLVINNECTLVQEDSQGYKTAILYKDKEEACTNGPLWLKFDESPCDVANYDVAIKLYVRDVRESSAYYSTFGFLPEEVEDNLFELQSIILKHCDNPGLKLILFQDGYYDGVKSNGKKSRYSYREVTFVLLPNTVEDFMAIKSYYTKRGGITEEQYTCRTNELFLKSVGNIHFEVLHFKRPV